MSEATAKRRWSLGLGISDCVLDRLSASPMLGLVLELEDVVKKGGIVTEIKVNLGG